MAKIVKEISKKVGLPPGSLVYVGDKGEKKFKITMVEYNHDTYTEEELTSLDACPVLPKKERVIWLDINSLHSVQNLQKLGECFSLHPLVLEDIVNTNQRPKIEDFRDYLYLVLRILSYQEAEDELLADQLSLIVGSNFVISLHESEEDIFSPIRFPP
jgi:magnesium transporter